MSVKDCLNEAVRIMASVSSDVLPTEYRDEIVRGMRGVLDSLDGKDPAVAIARMKAAAREADLDAGAAKFSKLAQKRKDPEITARFLKGDPAQKAYELRQFIDPLPGNRGAADQSYMTRVRGEVGIMQGRLNEVIARLTEGFYIRPTKYADELRRGLLGLATDDPQVAADVKLIRETFQPYLKRLQQAGVHVAEVENWWMRDWDLARILSNESRFDELMARGLSKEVHPDPGATVARMKYSLSERDTSGSKNLGIGMRRKIMFDDPEIEYLMMKEFGRGDLSAQLLRVIDTLSQEVTASEMLGPLWRQKVPQLARDLAARGNLKTAGRVTAAGKAYRQLLHAQAVINSHATDLSQAANARTTNITAALQNLVAATKLGLTPTWQVTIDPVISVLQSPLIQGNVFQRATGQLTRAFQLLTNEDLRYLARMHGIWRDAITMQGNTRLPFLLDPATQLGLGEAGVRSWDQKFLNYTTQLATMTQRATFSNLIENFNRSASHMQTMVALGRNFSRSWDDLHPRIRQWDFENNGIGKREWDSIRKTPIGPYGLPDLDELAARDPRAHSRWMGMLHREAEIAVVRSDASDRVFLTAGTTPGTIGNIVLSMGTQFLSWNTKLLRGPLARSYYQGQSPFVAFSAGLVIATAMGMQLRAAATGQPLHDFENPRFWWNAFLRSGVLGPFGETMVRAGTPGEVVEVPGAVPGLVARLTQLGLGGISDALNDDMEKAQLKAARIGVEFIPNWWQFEWFLRSTMEEIVWELDPDAARARERRLRQEGRLEN